MTKFHCCMDCGPDVIEDCKNIGCQVDKLVAIENDMYPGGEEQRETDEEECGD